MKKYNINFSLVVVNRVSDKMYSQLGNTRITKEELGCTLSHLFCLKEIIKNSYENAIIFEDDIIFHKNFKEMFMNVFQDEYDFLLLGACDFSFQTLNKDRILADMEKRGMEDFGFHKSGSKVKISELNNEEHNHSEIKITNFSNEFSNDDDNIEVSSINSDKTTTATATMTPLKPLQGPCKKYKQIYRPHENSVKVYGAHAIYYSLNGAKAMYETKMTNDISFFDKDFMPIFDKFETSSFICYPNLVISDISTSNLQHAYGFFSKSEELYYINCFDRFNFNDYNVIYLDIILKNKGVKIRPDDTYESFMTRLIKNQFSSNKERETIKNRLVLDFFTMLDLEKIKLNI
jgi:GR25 family glycosyltransferase involved in LPS biosynthesis